MLNIGRFIKFRIFAALFLFSVFAYLPVGHAEISAKPGETSSEYQQRTGNTLSRDNYLLSNDIPADTLHAPGGIYSSSESRQHYLQGKEYYSAGHYEEARNEFSKALDSINPPRLVTESPQAPPKTTEIVPVKVPVTKSKTVLKKNIEPPKNNIKTAVGMEDEIETVEAEEEGTAEEEVLEGGAEETATSALSAQVSAESPVENNRREYYIDVGDVLDISVWQIPDLSKPEVIVRPDGKISFPLIGDVMAEGRTLTQLNDVIANKLMVYVKSPQVSIMLRRFGDQANKVSILGEVLNPGVYRFSGPASIAEAVASAGGYTKYAVINSIMVISGDISRGKPKVNRINLVDILKGNKLSNNIILRPNDIVYVPRSFVGNVNVFMELIQPAISEYMQSMDVRRFHNIVHRNP